MRTLSRLRRPWARLRQAAGAAVMDNLWVAMARAGRLHPGADPRRHKVEVLRDVPYKAGGHPDHQLDIYRPAQGAGPWPTILYIHGGGFRILSKDTHYVMGLAFARRGYVVFNISYRLAPKHRYPAAVEDAVAAYRFVLERGSRYGADPQAVVVAGESAGANLAAGLTVSTCVRRPEPFARAAFELGRVPDACIPFCGLHQVTNPQRLKDQKVSFFELDRVVEIAAAYLGDAKAQPGEQHALADPVVLLEQRPELARPLPPFFLPVGTRDPLVTDNERMEAALRALGADVEARTYPGVPHAFHALVFLEQARRCWGHTYAFLDKALGERAPPAADAGALRDG